jgi:hypothetical protein
MRRFAARSAAAFLLAALLAQVLGAGAVLADDLRDMAADNTGLADNPETPGPDLYAPRVWGTDIPDMPSLIVLDAPADAAWRLKPAYGSPLIASGHDLIPRPSRSRDLSTRGPPSSSF